MKSKFGIPDDLLPLATVEDRLFTIAEAAVILNLSVHAVRNAIDRGKLKALNLALVEDANRAVWRISKQSLQAFVLVR